MKEGLVETCSRDYCEIGSRFEAEVSFENQVWQRRIFKRAPFVDSTMTEFEPAFIDVGMPRTSSCAEHKAPKTNQRKIITVGNSSELR